MARPKKGSKPKKPSAAMDAARRFENRAVSSFRVKDAGGGYRVIRKGGGYNPD